MKTIVVAPDKFKGSLTTFDVCQAIEEGLLQASPFFNVIKLPLADGGDGLSEVIRYYTGATSRLTPVQGPLGRTIQAEWLLSADGKTAFVEMAKASGLELLKKEERNPLLTSTYGTGQLIKAAVESGAQKIILGIGGSATNDGGMGMAAALGFRFLDDRGKEVEPAGGNLSAVAKIDRSDVIDLKAIEFRVACDVSNPLFGDEGAARVYAPQKGADAAMVETLEQGMMHFAHVLKQELGVDLGQTAGAGAAGGMGAGSLAFLRAALVSGIELVMQVAHFEQHLEKADVVITGEGKIDDQTLKGKVVMGIAAAAQKSGKKLIAFCGSQSIASNSLAAAGISAVFPIVKYPMDWEEAKSKAYAFLKDTAFSVGNLLQ